MDWQNEVLTEPAVALALRDFCRPGQFALDIGSHVGALTLEMSRLVGPFGRVVAIEANPFSAAQAARNLAENGCGNAIVVNRAVSDQSDQVLDFFLYGSDRGGVSDSLLARAEPPAAKVEVKSLVLDDLISCLGVFPDVIKIDIEGGEWDALAGLRQTLSASKPTLILEQTIESFRCVEFLLDAGYKVVDLASYQRIRQVADYGTAEGVRNIACIHAGRLGEGEHLSDYVYPDVPRREEPSVEVAITGSDTAEMSGLGPGRYLLSAEVECESDTEVKVGVRLRNSDWRMMIHGLGANPSVRTILQPFIVAPMDRGALCVSVEHLSGPIPETTTFRLTQVKRPGLPKSLANFLLS